MTKQSDVTEKSEQFLETVVKEFKIFIDTCSLLEDEADTFWATIVPYLERERKAIIVPYRVYEEVERFADNPVLCVQKYPDNPNLNARAKKVKNYVIHLQKAGRIEIYGENSDNFADNVFLTVFTQYWLKYNLLLITQDRDLARDIINIPKNKSSKSKNRIIVRRINKNGELSPFKGGGARIPHSSTSGKPANAKRPVNIDVIPEEEKFAFSKTIAKINGNIIVTYIPGAGDTVIAERGGARKKVKLIEAFASGGEGTIYHTHSPNFVARIYKKR